MLSRSFGVSHEAPNSMMLGLSGLLPRPSRTSHFVIGQAFALECRTGWLTATRYTSRAVWADGKVVRTEDPDVLSRALEDKNGLVWVDLTIQSDEDAWVLRDVFHFHELRIEDCVSQRVDPAKVDDYGSYLFIIVQAVTDYRFGEEMEPVEVDFYLGQNYVVSCRREPVPAIDRCRERCARDESLLSQPPDRLLHGLLDAIVDEYLPIVERWTTTSTAWRV